MSESSENLNPETEETPPALTPGDQLREAREAAGESLKDIAARTHQSIDTLKALETMQTGDLSPTVVRMQAARYARALGLSDKKIADGFAEQRSMMAVEGVEQKPQAFGRLLRGSALPVLAVAVLALISTSMLMMIDADRARSIDAIPVSKRLIERDIVGAEPEFPIRSMARVRGSEVSIMALKPAWIEVRGSDGTIFRSRIMAAGEVYYPRIKAGWTVTVRDAGAFAWALDGEQVMPIGQESAPVYSLSIDRAAEQAVDLRRQQIAEAAQD